MAGGRLEAAMEGGKLSAGELREALRAEFERAMEAVAKAVNDAPDGRWIRGSEEKVRDVMAEFRRLAFEKALQMRTDAAEASFPPSGGPGDRPAAASPGPAPAGLDDDQRPPASAPDGAAEDRRAGGRARRRMARRRR
jgi:hypothetical protein